METKQCLEKSYKIFSLYLLYKVNIHFSPLLFFCDMDYCIAKAVLEFATYTKAKLSFQFPKGYDYTCVPP